MSNPTGKNNNAMVSDMVKTLFMDLMEMIP